MKQIRRTSEDIGALCLALSHLFHAGSGTGDTQALAVEVAVDGADYTILRWQAVSTADGE